MSGLLFAFVATLLASLGARDQLLVAQMCQRQGARPGLLVVAVLSSAACSALAAWLATFLASEVPGIPARIVFAGGALVFAGGEAIMIGARRAPGEPTHSLFAALVVLAAQQLTDSVRFLVVALALVTQAPVPVAVGGAAGAALALAIGWAAPELAGRREVPWVRRVGGVILLMTGALLLWRATM